MLRQKAVHLTVLIVGIADHDRALGRGRTPFSSLGNERKDLDQQLKTATQNLTGPITADDAKAVTLLLKQGLRGGAGAAAQGGYAFVL